jgi:hypothetical protein
LAGLPRDGDDRAIMTERRTRRSRVHIEALAMFLDAQRTKLRSRGLAVMTRDGRMLAGSGPSTERLARTAIAIHEGRDDVACETTDVATWWLRAGGVEVVLASRGGRLSYDLGSGVRRILTS